jgi:hypothetical protein
MIIALLQSSAAKDARARFDEPQDFMLEESHAPRANLPPHREPPRGLPSVKSGAADTAEKGTDFGPG